MTSSSQLIVSSATEMVDIPHRDLYDGTSWDPHTKLHVFQQLRTLVVATRPGYVDALCRPIECAASCPNQHSCGASQLSAADVSA